MVKHNWQPFIPTESELKRHRWGRPIGFECTRCGMKRIDLIDARGMVSWRKYIRPDGYAIPGDKLPTTATLRVEYVRRVKGITNSNKEKSK